VSEFDSAAVSEPMARTFWQRRFLDPVVAQLTQGLTPHKIALTIAVGSAIAMFPILGTTTLICLGVGVVLKLNQPILQVVNYTCTPIHLPFIYYAFKWGEELFGVKHPPVPFAAMRDLLVHHPIRFFHDYAPSALHAIALWAMLMPCWIAMLYYASLPVLRGIERARREAAAKAIQDRVKDHPVP
jgi:uncharacterized protein (DUF2062 family)